MAARPPAAGALWYYVLPTPLQPIPSLVQAEIANIQKEKARIATATIDDEMAADPKLAEEVDAEIQKNYFMVS